VSETNISTSPIRQYYFKDNTSGQYYYFKATWLRNLCCNVWQKFERNSLLQQRMRNSAADLLTSQRCLSETELRRNRVFTLTNNAWWRCFNSITFSTDKLYWTSSRTACNRYQMPVTWLVSVVYIRLCNQVL